MLILVAIISHTAADAGYVLVIPLGGVIFYAAGRHPLAGIAAAFAGVSGGFSANFIPSSHRPAARRGSRRSAAQIIDPDHPGQPALQLVLHRRLERPHRRWSAGSHRPHRSSRGCGRRRRRRRQPTCPDGGARTEGTRGFCARAVLAMARARAPLGRLRMPRTRPLRSPDGELTFHRAAHAVHRAAHLPALPHPGVVYGYAAGTVKSHRDIIKGMSKAMSTMGYYIVWPSSRRSSSPRSGARTSARCSR
jgi:aminobenzoyl-glutamate transport protein